MTVWTNEWAGARVLSLFAARAPGRLAVPLLSWEILEEKRAGAGGAVASRATAEPRVLAGFPQTRPASHTPTLFQT